MLAKLIVCVLALAVAAALTLVQRQQRLEIAHELTEAHVRIRELEDQERTLRSVIADRARPDRVRRLLEGSPLAWRPLSELPGAGPVLTVQPPAPPAPGDDGTPAPPGRSPRVDTSLAAYRPPSDDQGEAAGPDDADGDR